MKVNPNVNQNLSDVRVKKQGNNGNGVGNTGTGNQGNDREVGNAGGPRVPRFDQKSTYVKGKSFGSDVPATDHKTYTEGFGGIKQNRNITAGRLLSGEDPFGNLGQVSGTDFSVDIGIDYQVSQSAETYNGITENNIKVSIDASLKGRFDSLNLDVAIENRQASGMNELNIDLSLEMIRNSSPSGLLSGPGHRAGGLKPQRIDQLLNINLDVEIHSSAVSASEPNEQSFFDQLSEMTSENIMDFVKSRFDLAMMGNDSPGSEKIDEFFEIIQSSIQDGYDAAMEQLGELPDEVSQSLEYTLELTMTKLEEFRTEVSS